MEKIYRFELPLSMMTAINKDNFFTIIIPTYNRPEFLQRSVKSVLDQTYSNFELIIVDDGSKIENKVVLKSFTDSRISVIEQDNLGKSSARNTGLKQVSGDMTIFLDDDDYFLSDYLLSLNNIIEREGKNKLIVTKAYWENEYTEKLEEEYLPDNMDINMIILHGINLPQCCIPSKLLKDLKFELDISYSQDLLFIVTILLKFPNIITHKRRFVILQEHPERSVNRRRSIILKKRYRDTKKVVQKIKMMDSENIISESTLLKRSYQNRAIILKLSRTKSPLFSIKLITEMLKIKLKILFNKF